ncbi:MAG: hypothetical protein PSV13_03910 [Lacunisphaera sp.]|nr:hypothetical protein [Lacunisphaera sp.]
MFIASASQLSRFLRCTAALLTRFGLALSLLGGSAWAASPSDSSPAPDHATLQLEPFIVSGFRSDLSWRYARAGDYEVLTLCSTALTADVLEALQRGHAMIPPAFQVKRTEPMTVILFDESAAQDPTRPKAVRRVASGDSRYGPNHFNISRLVEHEITSDREHLFYAACIPAGSDWSTVSFGHAFQSFDELAPSPARWLQEGLWGEQGLYAEGAMHRQGDAVKLPSMLWLTEAETAKIGRQANYSSTFIPLAEFFIGVVPDPATSPDAYQRWQAQAALFVRWALVADKKVPFGADAFWRFAYEAGRSRASEALFRECFQRTYDEALRELQAYLRVAATRPVDIGLPGLHQSSELRRLKLRPATEAEVARLKGNYERMEANRLKADHPKLAQQYEGEARRTLKRGLKATDHDPQLRGILGLLEFDAGNLAEARPHLEAAAAANLAGTHALLALARLRLDEERARLPADAKLSAAALEQVLTPLFAARERRPSVVDVYLLIAEAWGLSATPPTRGNLSVLIEGTEFFPHDPTLLLRAAKLHARNGFTTETVVLAELGMKTSGDPAAKARFAEIINAGSPSP